MGKAAHLAGLLLLLALLPPASLPLVVGEPSAPGSTADAAVDTAATRASAPQRLAVTTTGAGEIPVHGESAPGARGDFATTPDDLWFCKDRHHCHEHGSCDVATGKCVCDHPWYGEDCANAVVNAEISGNDVHVSMLEPSATGQSARADGNEMFLAKAHHRLRQVVAELSLTSDGCERDAALCRERKRLMRLLGLSYTSPSTQAGHAFDTTQAPAKVAAEFPSNRGLPAVTTMRWNDRVNDDKPIVLAVQDALKSAFKDTLAGRSHLHQAKWEQQDQAFPMSVEREHKQASVLREIVPGVKVVFDQNALSDGGDQKRRAIVQQVSRLTNSVKDGAPGHVVKEHIASLKKTAGTKDAERAVSRRLAELERVIAAEENEPSVPEEELESRLMRLNEKKIADLTKIVGGKSAKIDQAISDLSAAIAGHGKSIVVNELLAVLEKALGDQPTQRVQDTMKELKNVVVDGGAEDSDNDSNGGNLVKQRVAELGIVEEELESLEQGHHKGMTPTVPKADNAPADAETTSAADAETTSAADDKMDEVLSQTITLRGVTSDGLHGAEPRKAITRAIADFIGVTIEDIAIDRIEDVPVARTRLLLSSSAVDVAIRVTLTSVPVAKNVFSRMSDLFASVPSVVKKFASKLEKADGLKAKPTEKVAGSSMAEKSEAVKFIKATKPAWDQRKHDEKISSMKRVEAAVADLLDAVEHVEAGLLEYNHMGSGFTYQKPFTEAPETFLGPATLVGDHSVMGRLKSSDIHGAHAWLSEPEDQGYDLWHMRETGSWLSLAPGVHTTDEGTKFEVVSCVVKGLRLNRCRHSLAKQTAKKKTWVAIAQVADLSKPHAETRGQKDRDPEFKRVYVRVNDGDGSATLTQQGGSWFNLHKEPRKYNGTATTVSVLFIPEGKGHINGKAYAATRIRVTYKGTALTYGEEFAGALPAVFVSAENRGGDPYTLRLRKRNLANKKGCEVIADEGMLSKSVDKHHVEEKAQVFILQV